MKNKFNINFQGPIGVSRISKDLPLEDLEISIAKAVHDVDEEMERGIERFGAASKQRDYTAIFALQQVIIQLQDNLVRRVLEIAAGDQRTYSDDLIDAANTLCATAVAALTSLQRLLQAAPIVDMDTMRVGPSSDIQYKEWEDDSGEVWESNHGTNNRPTNKRRYVYMSAKVSHSYVG